LFIFSFGWTPTNSATYYVVRGFGGGAPATGYFRLNSSKTGYIDQAPWPATDSTGPIQSGQTYYYTIEARSNTSSLGTYKSASVTVPSCI